MHLQIKFINFHRGNCVDRSSNRANVTNPVLFETFFLLIFFSPDLSTLKLLSQTPCVRGITRQSRKKRRVEYEGRAVRYEADHIKGHGSTPAIGSLSRDAPSIEMAEKVVMERLLTGESHAAKLCTPADNGHSEEKPSSECAVWMKVTLAASISCQECGK